MINIQQTYCRPAAGHSNWSWIKALFFKTSSPTVGIVRARSRKLFHVVALLSAALWYANSAWAQGTVASVAQEHVSAPAQLTPIMLIEERLSYLRKLKAFLEADPLDMAEFERQFDLKLKCRPWGSAGKVCGYHTKEARWPYAEFDDKSDVVNYMMFGDGTEDSLWISLLYPGNMHAYNCITGTMLRQVFVPPEWRSVVDTAVSRIPSPHPSQALVLALHGRDRQQRRITIVTTGVSGCTGKLQITIHPNT